MNSKTLIAFALGAAVAWWWTKSHCPCAGTTPPAT